MTETQDVTPLQIDSGELPQGVSAITDDPEPELGDDIKDAHGHEQGPDFGTSEMYGERLNYEKKKCRNPICFIIYYLHVFALIGCTIWLCGYLIPEYLNNQNGPNSNLIHSNPNQLWNINNDFNDNYTMNSLYKYNNMNLADEASGNTEEEQVDEFEFTGIAVALITCAATGVLFGFIWYVSQNFVCLLDDPYGKPETQLKHKRLQVLNCCAGPIIKSMLILNILVWLTLFIVGCVYVNIWLIISSAIFLIIFTLWSWCVWDRVRFAVVLMV